jgi:hypothetical protein
MSDRPRIDDAPPAPAPAEFGPVRVLLRLAVFALLVAAAGASAWWWHAHTATAAEATVYRLAEAAGAAGDGGETFHGFAVRKRAGADPAAARRIADLLTSEGSFAIRAGDTVRFELGFSAVRRGRTVTALISPGDGSALIFEDGGDELPVPRSLTRAAVAEAVRLADEVLGPDDAGR